MLSICSIIFFSTTGSASPVSSNTDNVLGLATNAFEKWKIDCPVLPPRDSIPKSASDLRIDDIGIIGAIGDSITAGWFAKGNGQKWPNHPTSFSLDLLREDRGVSWVAGGDNGAITIPNMIKKFNPHLLGQSFGSHGPNICYGLICPPIQYGYLPDYDHLNIARSGSLYKNLPTQAKHLISQLKQLPNFMHDWKLVNVFIGSNDVCLSCSDFLVNPESFESTMKSVISTLRNQVPRLVLNIQQQFNVTQVYTLTKDQPYCASIRSRGLFVECKCAFREDSGADLLREYMDLTVERFNAKLEKIQRHFERIALKSDFMLIIDPLFTETDFSSAPLDFISNIDCFHPTRHAHELMAIGVWNNLFLGRSQKKRKVEITGNVTLHCPVESDRIRSA